DGIRDGHVTGVQTCALPILILSHRWPESYEIDAVEKPLKRYVGNQPLLILDGHSDPSSLAGLLWHDSAAIGDRVCSRSKVCSSRSEERRVGKECGSWCGRKE